MSGLHDDGHASVAAGPSGVADPTDEEESEREDEADASGVDMPYDEPADHDQPPQDHVPCSTGGGDAQNSTRIRKLRMAEFMMGR